MPPKRDHQLLIDAARMYYIEDLDQGQIARRMGMSRSTVSRILSDARELGLVEIRIAGDDHVARNRELEAALVKSFGVREALVAETGTQTTQLSAVGQLASQLFTRRGATATRIGLSWGFTVGQMVDAIPQMVLRPQTKVTPLVGGMPTLDTSPSGNTTIQLLADKCGITAERFDAPAVIESTRTHRAMMSESSVQAALSRARSCDLAFVGIGNYGVHTSRFILDAMRLDAEEMGEFTAQQPVGDCLGRFFDIEGVPLGLPTSERVIGITIEQLAEISMTVALAAGREKARGLLGALRTGSFDAVVVDESLASTVLALASS